MNDQLGAACVEISRLKNNLGVLALEEEAFKGNDKKVCFYTGIPSWDLFSKLFMYLKPHLSSEKALTPFQQLIMTLMRLQLNLTIQDLAFRFKVHKSTISRIFVEVISTIYYCLRPLIQWPDRDALLKTLPMNFRKHCTRCAVLIDCFENFLEKPSNLLCRAQTFSSYKHHNTVKYLIGITPQGTVCFISDGWGGRVSDKHMAENSNLASHLTPGDTILAEQGFDIKESIGLYCATVAIPNFTRGKKQITGIGVEQSRRIANVRIHVERVIGVIRQKYTIIISVTAKDGITLLDQIVCVCCSLINLCDSVVPFE